MKLRFSKMHGLGNDFVVLDGVSQRIELDPAKLRFLADRRLGIGCDQVLLVEPSAREGVDFVYRIFNADGSEAEQCGNGARCCARFIRQRSLSLKDELVVETKKRDLALKIIDGSEVQVDMGEPVFCGSVWQDMGEEGPREMSLVSMGNPHAVLVVENVEAVPAQKLALAASSHEALAEEGANAGFMEIRGRSAVRLRVVERGAGETMACGTGACAAVAAGIRKGLLDSPVRVDMRGGSLTVSWGGEGKPLLMRGPAVMVYSGEIEL